MLLIGFAFAWFAGMCGAVFPADPTLSSFAMILISIGTGTILLKVLREKITRSDVRSDTLAQWRTLYSSCDITKSTVRQELKAEVCSRKAYQKSVMWTGTLVVGILAALTACYLWVFDDMSGKSLVLGIVFCCIQGISLLLNYILWANQGTEHEPYVRLQKEVLLRERIEDGGECGDIWVWDFKRYGVWRNIDKTLVVPYGLTSPDELADPHDVDVILALGNGIIYRVFAGSKFQLRREDLEHDASASARQSSDTD